MTQEQMEKAINSYTKRLDRHLEIYANNGKELKELKEEVTRSFDHLTQNLGELRSDMKDIQIKFSQYVTTINGLVDDKSKRDDWVTWFTRLIFGALIMAVLVLLGINLK